MASINRKIKSALPAFFQATGLKPFASDAAYVTAKGEAAAQGDAYFNTTLDEIRIYDGSTWLDVLTGDGSGNFVINGTTQSTNKDTGALVVDGGVGIEKNAYVGGNLDVTGTLASGGAATLNSLSVTTNATITGNLTVNGTTTTINSATLDIDDANITLNVDGNQAAANSAVAGLTVEMSDATNARIGYDSTSPTRFKAGETGSEDNLVGETATQTIQNKTIDGTSASGDNTISIDADDATYDNAISGLSATDVQGALDEIDSDLDSHIAATSAHGISGDIVGTTDTQTLTNKTIDADNNTISNLAHGAEVDNPSSGVHGVTGNIVGDSDTQTLTNKTIDSASNTITNIDDGDISASADIARTKLAQGTANHVLINDGTGEISSEAALAKSRGGTGADNSSVTFPSSGTIPTESSTSTLTNKTINADNNTISNLEHGAEVDDPSSGVHGVTGSVVGTTDTQTLSNKTLSNPDVSGALNFNEISTPSTPSTGENKLYFKSDAKLYKLDDTGAELEVGSGSGEGGINFVTNSQFESNANDWNTYDDGASANPTDGTGGSPSAITLARTTTSSEVLRNNASLKIAKSAANGQGEGVSTDINIDPVDAGEQLEVSFYYNASDSNYVSGDLKVYIYDVTNTEIIDVITPVDGEITRTGNFFRGSFYTNSSSESYRLIFHCTTTATDAWDLFIDNVKVAPIEFAVGKFSSQVKTDTFANLIDATTTAPTFGTVVKDVITYKRDGSDLIIRGEFQQSTNGVAGSGRYLITLPDGLSVDTDKVNPHTDLNYSGSGHVGWINTFNSANQDYVGPLIMYSATKIGALIELGGSARGSWDNGLQPFTSLRRVSFSARVPIEGWDEGATLAPNEVEVAKLVSTLNGGGAVTSGNAFTGFTAAQLDNYDAFNESTGEYTVPKDGDYMVSMHMSATGGTSAQLQVYVNGSQQLIGMQASSSTSKQVSGLIPNLSKGDVITIRPDNTITPVSDDLSNYLSITEIPNFKAFSTIGQKHVAVLTHEETSGTAGGTFTAGSYQTRPLNTLTDTGIGVTLSSNQFTLPPGKYKIHGHAVANVVNLHRTRLQNITDSVTEFYGTNGSSTTTITLNQQAPISGVVTIQKTTTFELQHRCTTTRATNGFGTQLSYGDNEVYASIVIEKVG